MSLFEKSDRYRPVKYPEFDDAHTAVMQSSWSPFEVSMAADLKNWEEANEGEKQIIGGILKGFTSLEVSVGCYWRNIVANTFGCVEIVNMATAFSAQEAIHTRAYDYLEASLNLDSYDAFKHDKVASNKVQHLMQRLNETDLSTSLAVFSAFCEGVSLFSSFAVLLSFTQEGKFKGLSQLLSWSIADENLHSLMGIKLFDLVRESADEAMILEGCKAIVENEISFIEHVFANQSLAHITKEATIDFIKYRANKKMMELKYPPVYSLSGEYKSIKHFFNTITDGKTLNDFFAVSKEGSSYSASLTQNFAEALIR